MANNWELTIPLGRYTGDGTNPPGPAMIGNRFAWSFHGTTPQTMYSQAIQVPASSLPSGTLKFDLIIAMATETSGTVEFEVAVEAVTDGDHDLDTGSFFAAVNNGSVTVPGTAGNTITIPVTLTNDDSYVAGDLLRLSVSRDADDATNDSTTGLCYVLATRLYEEAA